MTRVTATPAATVRLEGVSKAFIASDGRQVSALSQIDLSVAAGEIVALVGPSGCGKSTLLRLMAGLEFPAEGQIRVGAHRVTGPDPECGMVFQEHRLLPWLNVVDNIAFGLRAFSRHEREQIVAEQIAQTGLTGFERSYPHQLSGGMAQRAALARALAPKPPVLLLDEPFGALDAFTKMRMQDELLRAREHNQPTTLLVTHDIEEAVFLADRVLVLSERPGRVQRSFEIDLAHPRDRTSSEFSSFRRTVLREFGIANEPPAEVAEFIPIHRGLALASRTKEVS